MYYKLPLKVTAIQRVTVDVYTYASMQWLWKPLIANLLPHWVSDFFHVSQQCHLQFAFTMAATIVNQ